jgi:hypothetical protein
MSDKIKKISGATRTTNQTDGCFARVLNDVEDNLTVNAWGYCREGFHQNSNIDYFLMWHAAKKGPDIEAFIHAVERRLKHSHMSEIGPTNFNRVCWVKPAEFWKRNAMRRSFFTILLRCAMHYDLSKDNFDKALFSLDYTTSSRQATKRFLEGYTWYKGSSTGWCNQFRSATATVVKSLLTKRPVDEKALLKFALAQLGVSKDQLSFKLRQVKLEEKAEIAAKKASEPKKPAKKTVKKEAIVNSRSRFGRTSQVRRVTEPTRRKSNRWEKMATEVG